jgi:hypothetical protein
MMEIAQFEEMLGGLAAELPDILFRDLNQGIVVLDREKLHPKSVGNELYIIGEYQRSILGSGIVIYYLSFMKVYGNLPEEGQKAELRRVLRHEFRHHWEFLAGERALEVEDEHEIARYLEGKNG